MEEQIQQSANKSTLHNSLKWFLYGLSIFLVVLIIMYAVLVIISARQKIEVYNNKLSQIEILQENDVEFDHPALAALNYEKAFLSSQHVLMNTDSLNLIIDLKDSIIALAIEGVTIHVCELDDFSYSKFFSALSPKAYCQIFSSPFFVESFESTIVKEPITIKEAPKDTTEAANFFELPDTIIDEFVAVNMNLNHDIILILKQEEEITSSFWSKDRHFLLELRMHKIYDDLRQMLFFRLPKSRPELSITLPKDDLVTFYRALPRATLVSVRLR